VTMPTGCDMSGRAMSATEKQVFASFLMTTAFFVLVLFLVFGALGHGPKSIWAELSSHPSRMTCLLATFFGMFGIPIWLKTYFMLKDFGTLEPPQDEDGPSARSTP
jgi:hypothetical protein